ncbi:snaclec coagulation factor IX/factor X-binding protein subunit B3-like [Branchiostoma floridae x Branchiostoma japonicum]
MEFSCKKQLFHLSISVCVSTKLLSTTPVQEQQTDFQARADAAASVPNPMYATGAASCPEGYAEFRGICYKAYDTKKTFSDAGAFCGEDGGTLAMPRDAETDDFLISLHNAVSDRLPYWIEPNNLWGDEYCVLYFAYRKDKWKDFQCDFQHPFICQAVPGRP